MANNTISQITVSGTTFDICDVEARRNSGYAYIWKEGLSEAPAGSQYKTVNANTSVSLGSLCSLEPTGTLLSTNESFISSWENTNGIQWPHIEKYPCFYQIILHTVGTATNYSYNLELDGSSTVDTIIHRTYIKPTSDCVSTFTGFIYGHLLDYEVFINPDTQLSKVWGTVCLLIYKTELYYPFTGTVEIGES